VYRRVVNLDRLAFDLASRDAAAIIACDRFDQLPESLRRLTDVTLRLSSVDSAVFGGLFEQVTGTPLTPGWDSGGDAWVKHLLHTDFEQPRRLGMQPDKALDYVRSMVIERLVSVDTQAEMGVADLHGLGEARQFAQDLIADIHAAIRGEIPWNQVDRGALLVGPPGTGKTTLARAIAKDCGVRFINASATGWQAAGDHLGHHIAAIRKTFAEARGYAPSILFIDEIDSLGNRETFEGRGSQYQTEVVNAVLEQIQDIDPAAPVFVIGATNNVDRVDTALRRSGRLDRVIHIPRPSSDALQQIFEHYLKRAAKHTAIDAAVDTKTLGGLSLGLTGADVERIVRGASRRARKERRSLSQQDVIAEITNKPRNASESVRMTPAEIERVAWHESGHALAMLLSSSRGSNIGFVTVVPRADGSLGFVAPLPDERVSLTRRDYDETLEVYLGGRAAEEIRFGAEGISSGASSDLRGATALASLLLTRLGLGGPRQLRWQEQLADSDRPALEAILVEAYERVLGKLHANRDRLKRLAETLLTKQELTGDEVRAMLP
jgi:ATP-dependent Zn protease